MKPSYADAPDFPQIVGIETTAHCNASCVFCPLHGSKSDMVLPKGLMSMRVFEKIVRELSAHRDRIDVIFLNVRGEPLLDPNFNSRLCMLKEYGLNDKISIQTNGQFLDKHKAEVILDNEIGQIVLGFDAASKRVYERHRINCDYETVLNNMRIFVELRNKAGSNVRVSIKYVYTHENQHEIRTAYKMWTKVLASRLDNFMLSPSGNWANSRIRLGRVCYEDYPQFKQGQGPLSLAAEFNKHTLRWQGSSVLLGLQRGYLPWGNGGCKRPTAFRDLVWEGFSGSSI